MDYFDHAMHLAVLDQRNFRLEVELYLQLIAACPLGLERMAFDAAREGAITGHVFAGEVLLLLAVA